WNVLNYFDNNVDHYISYRDLDQLDKRVPQKEKILVREQVKKIDPETGEQVVIDGVPQFDTVERWEETGEIIEVIKNLSGNEVNNLRAIYQQSFKDAYRFSYSRQYASRSYIEQAISAEKYGQTAGTLVGQLVAKEIYEQIAYDLSFKNDSKVAFFKEIDTRFQNKIKTYTEVFNENPVFELDNVSVIGDTKDNIFRANESLSVDYSIWNLGLVSGERNISLRSYNSNGSQNNDLTSLQSESIQIPGLKAKTGSTGVLAKVGDYDIGSRISAVFSINQGPTLGDIDNVLVMSKNVPFNINDYAEVKSIKKVLTDTETGVVTVEVVFTHPANPNLITSTSSIGTLSTNKGVLNEQTLNVVYAGGETVIQFTSTVDPIEFINNRSLNFSVSNQIEGRTAEVKSDSITTVPYESAVLKHFEAVVSGRSSNCGTAGCSLRIEKLFDHIDDIVASEIKTKWHKQYQNTFLYRLKNTYNAIKSDQNSDQNFQTTFDRLMSERLVKRLKQVKPGALNGPRKAKKAYFKILKSMAPRKLNRKWKKYL
ncbi:hypothetical protein N9N67_03585, partial [Bacteriovoracaceae bacterium]|nr:hypothetical protein [Bacteriovoracaceae bacterium]